MKQHLVGDQLKEIEYEERITLLSLALGMTRKEMKNQYKEGVKKEDAILLKYSSNFKVGELIEIVEVFTGKFPVPNIEDGKYRVKIYGNDFLGRVIEVDSMPRTSYCDALYEIVKVLLKEGYIINE